LYLCFKKQKVNLNGKSKEEEHKEKELEKEALITPVFGTAVAVPF
jgi:hypothetical protein